MGFGFDEDEEEFEEREPTENESLAIDAFDYDVDEFFELSYTEQQRKIWMAKKMNKTR